MGRKGVSLLFLIMLVVPALMSCDSSEKGIVDCAEAPINASFNMEFRGAQTSVPVVVDFTYAGKFEQGMEFSWDFGDGGTSKQQTASHVFQKKGTYRVVLYVTRDVSGERCSKSTAQDLVIE
ncbi:hypothetical protein FUAX_46870 (plasmid) [Fulvitalea axinellae]|uniref:PKD domain-containing protein n=1 Tax=Fulvitalea axinellae TaxID=1182444 RepID=A0AAU9DI54_9BACT|nr:hypothetical protein FUAX_46870 [Fulvitalea axinellae]